MRRLGASKMIRPLLFLVILAGVVTAAGARAATDRVAACAPKPRPALVKKPPAGASATQLANFLIALPQRKPCDVNRFTSEFLPGPWPGLYPEGSPMALAVDPTPGVPHDEAKVRAQLAAFLKGSGNEAAALALFNRADVRRKVPEPTLRAALVSLRGTAAESVIEWYVSKDTTRVDPRFGGLGVRNIARSAGYPPNQEIIFNVRYAGEHFALLSAFFAHEILHHDVKLTATEEVILHALTAVVHMQLLSRHPDLATSGTELARYTNDFVLLFVNSRVPGSAKSAIFAPTGRGTAPGSARSQRDFSSYAKEWGLGGLSMSPTDSTPAPPVFATVLRRLLAPGVAIPKPLTYSRKTAELFSKLNDTWLSPVDRLRVSVLLGLVSVDEIVKYTGLTRAKAIATFRLAPILAGPK